MTAASGAVCDDIERIVVIHDFAAPEGGAGVLANLAAREYARRGIPVTYFAGAVDGAGPGLEGIDLVGLHAPRLLDQAPHRAMVQGFHNRAARDCLRDWISANDTARTVYHLHNWSQILSPAVFEALQGVAARLIVTCHDFFNLCPNGSFTHFPRSQACDLKPLSFGCIASQCDRRSSLHKYWRIARQVQLNRQANFARSPATFVFLHERMKQKFVESGFAAANMATIPNPVAPWSADRIPAEANHEFLFVGRIGRDKGADLAAAAAADTGAALTLIGQGELADSLRGSGGRLQLAGWCDRAGILSHARRARALIVPSRVVEPFGLVILEAAMSGLPVLVSNRAYLADDVERLGFGLAFDPAEPGSLANALSSLATGDALVRAMSQNGHARAGALCLTEHDWSARHLGLFRAILQGSAKSNAVSTP